MTMLAALWYLVGLKKAFGIHSLIYVGAREALRAWLWAQGMDYWLR